RGVLGAICLAIIRFLAHPDPGGMNAMRFAAALFGLLLAASAPAPAEDPQATPRPIPLTRPEMKQLLEDMKSRTPRIPLPELTEEERELFGERGSGYEGRLRAYY